MSEPYITYEVARTDDGAVQKNDDGSVIIYCLWQDSKYAQPAVEVFDGPFETAENVSVVLAHAMRVNLAGTP